MPLVNKAFVFARHAQSTCNAAAKIGGATDSPLSTEGRQQAQAARVLLNRSWSGICTSDLLRTIQTAELAVPHMGQHHFSTLRERNWGALEGQPIDNNLNYFQTPPDGESWQDFLARTIDCVNTILLTFDTPLIIAHSGTYRALQHAIFGSPFGTRIGNVDPVFFRPNSRAPQGWDILPLQGHIL